MLSRSKLWDMMHLMEQIATLLAIKRVFCMAGMKSLSPVMMTYILGSDGERDYSPLIACRGVRD